MLIDPKTYEILGVIDWEMSKKVGLPLLDLLYLIGRTRGLFEKKDFTEILIDNLFPLQLSPLERKCFDKYVRSISLEQEMVLPLSIMCWVNHIIYRAKKESYDKEFHKTSEKVISSIVRYLEKQ